MNNPPMLRLGGDLVPDGEGALSASEVEALLLPLLPAGQRAQFATIGDLDFAYAHGTKARFRANYLRKTTGPGAVFRVIPSKIGAIKARDALEKALDKASFARIPAVARQLAPEERADLEA